MSQKKIRKESNIVLIDTGFIVALLNERDENHERACELSEKIDNFDWVTTSFVFQEIYWLLSDRVGANRALEFVDFFADSDFLIKDLPDGWMKRLGCIVKKYSTAKIDLADASLVLIAEELETDKIASVDQRDFNILRWGNPARPFKNLMVCDDW